MLKNKRVTIINLGCKANKYESDAMTDKLIAAGFLIVDMNETADIYIVNTCSVTNVAEKKSRQMLRRAKKKNPKAIVVAVGCYVNASPKQLEQMDFVDLIIGNNRKKEIVEVLRQYFAQEEITNNYIDINHTHEFEEMGALEASELNHQRAYIKIQDGCNQFCSYCIIPYTRGRVRSRKPEHVLEEIQKLAKEGVKEFVLTGIHISSYGLDFQDDGKEYDDAFGGKGLIDTDDTDRYAGLDTQCDVGLIRDLGDLVYAISLIPEVARIRLGSLEPRIITKDFLDKITYYDKLCPHFHLSLQSGCNDTLKRMNRKYTIEEFEEKCNLIRSYFEKPAITTDVIVGFPGETEEEFAVTLDHLNRLNLYEIHVFKYSVRSGTVAEKLPNQVPEQVKNIRSD
ncbi:MAG: MiaB/RimO family radical SAM methylthiotransferase, partial [Lachnospiraceae bacterium]